MTNESKTASGRNKRGQGEGSFTALPDGRVRWRVMVTTQAGERRHPSGTARNLTEARKAVREVREAALRNGLPPRERVTVEELVTTYIEHRTPMLRWRTVQNYEAILQRNIVPTFGSLKAQGVTVLRLREFYSTLREGGQGDSVRRQVHNLIHAAYKLGLSNSVVTVNPAAQARPVYTEGGQGGRPTSYSPDNAAKFYEAARADRWGWPLAFMLATGVRPGEALALRWEHVSFKADDQAVVSVLLTRSVSSGTVYEGPTKSGQRELKITGDVVVMLREAKAQSEREQLARLTHNGRPYQSTDYVFRTRAGTAYRPDNLRRPMWRLCEAVGVPVLTPHKLRHTWTSVFASEGVSLEVLSKQLGHKNPTVTRNFYRQVFEEERAALTYDPVTLPPPRERIKVRIRRAVGKLKEPPPSAAPKVRKTTHQA